MTVHVSLGAPAAHATAFRTRETSRYDGVMRWLAVVLLCGCGRVGFDGPASGGDSAGLIAHYTLDETEPPFVEEIGGHDGDCDVAGGTCPTATDGHLGGAFDFDGRDDCIVAESAGALAPPEITISIWARFESFDQATLVGKRVGNASQNSWQLETDPNNRRTISFTAYDGTSGVRLFTPDNTVVLQQWQHVVATYDGTTKRLYVDGVELAAADAPSLRYDARPIRIGCDQNGPTILHFFEGALDDFRIYDRALAEDEIAQLRSAEPGEESKRNLYGCQVAPTGAGTWLAGLALLLRRRRAGRARHRVGPVG